jgi:peptide/nickel transport system substrate-binding protein
MKRYPWTVLVLIVTVLLLSACGTPSQTAAPEETQAPEESGGAEEAGATEETMSTEPVIARVGWAGSPDTLNPGAGVLSEAYTIYELVYDSMYQEQLDGTYTLELAESVDVSDDGTVWTFHIRHGIKWHDGEDLTANDIAFSYHLYQDTVDFPYLPVYTDYFETIEAPDDYTVVITLSEAIPNMESQLIFLYVIPEHIWADYADNATEFENAEMIGSGPFKLVDYSQNEFVHLEANHDHYLYNPNIDEVVFQTFENQDALVQAIKTGQVDMITEMPATAVASLRNEPNVEVVTGPPLAPEVTDIIFNMTPDDLCPEDGVCSGKKFLQDHDVRLALAYATDKTQIIDVVLLGLGSPGLTLIPDSLGVWYNDSIEDYPYDPDMARQILEDAGYVDSDGDGVRESPSGEPMVLRMNWPSDSIVAPRLAEMLHDMWLDVGVNTELQALDPDTLTSVCCPTFDFDVILWGWGSDPDPGFLLSVMTTDEIPTGNSETGYSNPEYDDLYRQQQVELDPEQRREIIWQMQEIVHEDLPYIIPFYTLAVQAYRTDTFTGWLTDEDKLALFDVTSLVVIKPVQ